MMGLGVYSASYYWRDPAGPYTPKYMLHEGVTGGHSLLNAMKG